MGAVAFVPGGVGAAFVPGGKLYGPPWLGRMEEVKQEQPKCEVKRGRLGQWSRALRLRRGTIYLDFNDSGAETYFKITHSVSAEGGEYRRQTLFFDRKELVEYLSAMRLLDGKLRSGEGVPPGLMVSSLSGDITFDVAQSGGATLLAVTQRKEYDGGKQRVNTVSLAVGELPMLVKGVEEALQEWRK